MFKRLMVLITAMLMAAPAFAQCTEGAVGNAAPQSFAPLASVVGSGTIPSRTVSTVIAGIFAVQG